MPNIFRQILIGQFKAHFQQLHDVLKQRHTANIPYENVLSKSDSHTKKKKISACMEQFTYGAPAHTKMTIS